MRLALLIARRVAIVVLLGVILLHPGYGQRPASTQVADLEVLVVVDRTRSMAALDYQDGPRVDGVRTDLTELADALPGARLSLLTFGKSAMLELPFTSDAEAFTTAVETMRLEGPFDGGGSRADRPLEQMREILERADRQHPDRQRIVIFVGDGENTADGDQASYSEIAGLVDGGVVLGYGTADGAKIPEADDLSPDGGFVYDFDTGEDAISRIDEDNLRTVADQLGIGYLHRTQPGGMDAVADDFDTAYTFRDGGGSTAANDLTWLFGLLLLGLILVELHAGWRSMWTAHTVLQVGRGGAES